MRIIAQDEWGKVTLELDRIDVAVILRGEKDGIEVNNITDTQHVGVEMVLPIGDKLGEDRAPYYFCAAANFAWKANNEPGFLLAQAREYIQRKSKQIFGAAFNRRQQLRISEAEIYLPLPPPDKS